MTQSTFAPDERPHAPRPPWEPEAFTPEQDTRLREMMWQACEAHALYLTECRYGRPIEAARTKESFLTGSTG